MREDLLWEDVVQNWREQKIVPKGKNNSFLELSASYPSCIHCYSPAIKEGENSQAERLLGDTGQPTQVLFGIC